MQKCNEAFPSVDQNNLEREEAQASGSDVSVTDFLSVEVDQNDSDYDMDEEENAIDANDMVKKENTTEIIETEFIKSEVIEDNGSES